MIRIEAFLTASLLLGCTAAPPSARSTFTNPILPSPSQDPWVILHDGHYLYSESRDDGIDLRFTRRLIDLAASDPNRAWTAPRTGPFSKEIWAPELHHIDERWYLYFAADDGENRNHRMWVIASKTNSPLGPYDDPVQIATNGWAIDGTVFSTSNGEAFFLWSGWPRGADGEQALYIARMTSPTAVETTHTLLSRPTESWERIAMPIMEGPEVIQRDGKIIILYSASGSWTADYCLGILEYLGGEITSPGSWKKSGPVFSRSEHVFGVGHASIVSSPDGLESWIVYHAKGSEREGWEDRSVRAQRFVWDANGTPRFGTPIPPDTLMPIPSENGR
jgi:GH43 family beta-xylosidase